jgi:hypothetical protein
MGDTFGSGLDFGGAGAASAGEGNPMTGGPTFSGGADVPPPDTQPVPMPAAPAATPSKGGIFGSGISFGPNYTPPDPAATALDQTADLLQQRVKRANEIATNPLAQLFDPDAAVAARNFVPQATEALQKIKVQKAEMAANRQQAVSLGVSEVPDEAPQSARVEAAKAKALAGNLTTFQALKTVDPKTAEVIQDQVIEKVGSHLGNAQLAFDSLAGMQNQGQYEAKLSQLRRDGTLTDLEALGLKVPPSFDAFSAAKGPQGQILREARINLNNARNKLEARNTYQPMEKAEAETYNGSWKTAYGDEIKTQPARNAATNARAGIIDGYDDPRKLGQPGAVLATQEQREAIRKEAEGTVDKADLEKFRANNRTYQMATTDSKGNKLKDGEINTNPNVQQGIAEGLASMLRGGQGGANVGLLKIETSKRGAVQGFIDNLISNYAGGLGALTGEQVRPYLSKLTQAQQRDVLDMLHGYNNSDIPDRLAQTAKRAGALGLGPEALGFGTKEAAGDINKAIEEGRNAQIALDMQPGRHQAIGGGRGALSYGALKPVADNPTASIPGTTPTTQQPGAALQTPVQQSQNPQVPPPAAPSPNGGAAPAPTSPNGTAPAGGGTPQPVQIAGQTVTAPMPPGASPTYLANTQRIESGNERDPWKAGAKGSSASGAFQFINSTWAANKPPGAPDRAADATPAQQTEAMATLTAKNAAALQKNGLPVNDTNLYIAHNLGDGGAKSLLHADPAADARTIVGEAAARNNPLFFKGRPTVATVLARYQAEMNGSLDDTGPKPQPGSGGAAAEAPGLMTRISRMLSQGVAGGDAAKDKAVQDVGAAAVEHAPAIGATVGGITGGPLGGAAGGAGGQVLKDYAQGRDQSATRIAKEGALGGILGVASEARPVLAAGARVLGAGGVEGAAKAAEGGDVADVIDATAKGGAYALGGETLGRFVSALGPAAHKLFSKFTPDAQAELSAQAGKLVEARKVLATEQPKLAGEGAGVNPKYEAAKKAEEDASTYIKDHGQKPDDMAYAYEQVKSGVSAGEAATMRKANTEKSEVGEGYNQLRTDITDATKGQKNVKPNQAVPDGPLAQIRTAENPTGKVPEAFRPDAEHAELLIKAPAANWGQKWQQLQDAGSELIKKRVAFLADQDKPSAEAMNAIFEGVRNQQRAVAEHIFGKERGAEVIAHLENLDKRYAKVMNATAGMNYKKMESVIKGGNTPERRELEANFREFAKDDPSAIRAFNAMKAGAQGHMGEEAKLMLPVIAGEVVANAGGIPTVGAISAAIGGHRMYSLMRDYMNAKLLGKPVTFKDFFVQHMKDSSTSAVGGIVRNAAQNAALQ